MSDNDLWGLPELDTSGPSVTPQPSTADAIQEWVNAMPQIYNTQLEYAPKEAAMNVQLAQQYAYPLALALKTAQEGLYPNETALTNSLTQKAQSGMSGDMPDWAKQSYMDTMRAQLGENALSGAGADYMSRGLLEQQKNWQDYYTNLGLSISNRQPVYTANQPSTSNYMSNFTPSSAMGYTSNNYGTYQNALSNQYSTNASMYNNYNSMLGNIYGSGIGAMGTMAAYSSKRFKKNIKLWA